MFRGALEEERENNEKKERSSKKRGARDITFCRPLAVFAKGGAGTR